MKGVYQGYLFLQSKDLNKSQGVSVEKADRCKMVLDVFRRKKNQCHRTESTKEATTLVKIWQWEAIASNKEKTVS